jgi:hypothetical protein
VNPWSFVIAAYLLTLGGTAVLVGASWLAVRRAEPSVSSDVER